MLEQLFMVIHPITHSQFDLNHCCPQGDVQFTHPSQQSSPQGVIGLRQEKLNKCLYGFGIRFMQCIRISCLDANQQSICSIW